jgi:hypothetical protein
MTTVNPAAREGTSQQVVVEAALVLLERMGLSAADLTAIRQERPAVPTFAEYVPVVSAAVTAGTRRAYGSYWNRVTERWGQRRLDDITPSEIRQLMTHVKTHVVARRNARGGRSAAEYLVAALRCVYQRAVDDGLISEKDNPARKVAKPRRLPSTRRAIADTRLAEINQVIKVGQQTGQRVWLRPTRLLTAALEAFADLAAPDTLGTAGRGTRPGCGGQADGRASQHAQAPTAATALLGLR